MDERGFKRKHSDVTWFMDMKLIRSVHDFVDSDRPIQSTDNGNENDAGDAEI